MNKLILLSLIIVFFKISLCFSQTQNDFFVIKNSKIINTLDSGQQQLVYHGDIEIMNDSKDTYIKYLDQKIKINLDFSELIEKNKIFDSQTKDQGLDAYLFNQAVEAIQVQPYQYLKLIFQSWHQSTISLSTNLRMNHEIKLSEMQIQNTGLMKNDRFLSFEKVLVQLTLHYFSTMNLQRTADRLTAIIDFKVEKTTPPVKKHFGFIHFKDSPKDIKRLSSIGFMQSSEHQAAKPQGFIGFIRPMGQCHLLFDK